MKTRYTPEQIDVIMKAKKQYESLEQDFLVNNQDNRLLTAAELVSKQRERNKKDKRKDISNPIGH
jgi:hypothetical protein